MAKKASLSGPELERFRRPFVEGPVLEQSDEYCQKAVIMKELTSRTKATMGVVLEEVCCELPHGGDHESRRFVAERLIEAADAGQTKIGEFTTVARQALSSLARANRLQPRAPNLASR
jgi:hypothetical protein